MSDADDTTLSEKLLMAADCARNGTTHQRYWPISSVVGFGSHQVERLIELVDMVDDRREMSSRADYADACLEAAARAMEQGR